MSSLKKIKQVELGDNGRQRCMEEGNNQDWWEEVEGRSSLGWYEMTKEEFGVKTCIGSTQGQEAIRCRFQIRTGSAGLFADKEMQVL